MTHNPNSGGEPSASLIRCATTRFTPGREPLRHLLLGSPQAVSLTIHQLHRLQYAEAGLWSTHLRIPDHDLIVTPHDGEVLTTLVRYLRLE